MGVSPIEGTAYTTKSAVLRRAQEAVGIPLGAIDKTGRLKTGKGAIGTVLEESWFGYKPNSESEPDFPEAGVELKATPFLRDSKGIRAKERLVCNIIDYMTEYQRSFYSSSFWHKCETILIMSYEHKADVPKSQFTIERAILFSFPEEDLLIIKHDWEIIISKIRAGQAHLLTEGDTLYLAACTKASNASVMRKQPFSPQLAKPRAYSLKSTYMTQILNRYIFGTEEDEHVVKDWHVLSSISFEQYVEDNIRRYYGKSQRELCNILGISSTSKSINELILAAMLGISGKVSNTAEFKNANIIPKTIRVELDGSIRESMSFPTFKFTEIVHEDWENSSLRNYLEPARFLFVIFQKSITGEYILDRIKFWNIPAPDLEEVHRVWERTVTVLKAGLKTWSVNGVTHNNLPKAKENPVAHVRPHARNAADTYPLPTGGSYTKQCFWFNRDYVHRIIQGTGGGRR